MNLRGFHLGVIGALLAIPVIPRAEAALTLLAPVPSDPSGDFITLSTSTFEGQTPGSPGQGADVEPMPYLAETLRRMKRGHALDSLADPRTLELEDPNTRAALIASKLAFDYGDFEKAIAHAREALESDATDARAYFLLGSSLLALERNEEAREALNEALRLQPHYPEAMSNLAILRFRDGDTESALLFLVHALEQKIDYENGWRNYLTMLSEELLPREGLTDLPLPPRDGTTDKPAPAARWHWEQAIAAMAADKSELATRHFLRSLALNVNDPNPHNDFAVFLLRNDRRVLALPFLRAAAHLSPDAPLVQKNLADLAEGLRIEKLSKQAEALSNSLAKKDSAADRLALARVLRDLESEDGEIIEHLERAVALAAYQAPYQLELADALVEANRHRDAIEAFRPALESDGDRPHWNFHMARLLAQQPDPTADDLTRAVDHARLACELTEFTRKDYLDLLAKVLDAAGDSVGARAAREKADTL